MRFKAKPNERIADFVERWHRSSATILAQTRHGWSLAAYFTSTHASCGRFRPRRTLGTLGTCRTCLARVQLLLLEALTQHLDAGRHVLMLGRSSRSPGA